MNKKLLIVACGVFVLGVILGSTTHQTQVVTKEVEKITYKTPQSCKEALTIDNGIFSVVADGIQNMDYPSITAHVDSVTNKRIASYSDCMGN